MITNEEARKAIEKYQKEHPLPYGTIDVTAISSKEGADIISQAIEKISKKMEEDREFWCICEMAKMYMQGVRPVYPIRPHGRWTKLEKIWTDDDGEKIPYFRVVCSNCNQANNWGDVPYCPWCGAEMEGLEDEEENS